MRTIVNNLMMRITTRVFYNLKKTINKNSNNNWSFTNQHTYMRTNMYAPYSKRIYDRAEYNLGRIGSAKMILFRCGLSHCVYARYMFLPIQRNVGKFIYVRHKFRSFSCWTKQNKKYISLQTNFLLFVILDFVVVVVGMPNKSGLYILLILFIDVCVFWGLNRRLNFFVWVSVLF